MLRLKIYTILATLALGGAADAACPIVWMNQRWFESDARHYTAADLDADGVPEIVSASATTVAYRRWPQLAAFPVYTSTAIGAPVAGDVTGDGKIDLVIPNTGNNTLVVLPGNGNGTFGSAVATALASTPARIVLGNFSGDASLDVATIGSGASVVFLQGNGTGAFTQAGTVAVGASPFDLATANFDGDGYADVAVSHTGSSTVEVIFANGSGGSASTVSLDGGAAALLATGDFDGDGDMDLYSVRPSERRLDVFPYANSRTFGAVSSSGDLWYDPWGPARSIALADFDGDADLDLVLGLPGTINVWKRIPLTQFGQVWESATASNFHLRGVTDNARSIAAADFTDDGRVDVAFENMAAGYGGLFVNECSTVIAALGVVPVLTLGQSTDANISIAAEFGNPAPTGTARLSWSGGEKTVALYSTRQYGRAQTTIEGLPLGFQPIVVDYSGDANYPAATNTAWILVTTDTTATTITGPAHWTYGKAPTEKFQATVTSSTGDTPTGWFEFRASGTPFPPVGEGTAPVAEAAAPAWLGAGTHTVTAELVYSLTHPPSTGSMQVTVDKATAQVFLSFGLSSRAGESAWLMAEVRPDFLGSLSGTVRIKEGDTTLATASLNPNQGSSQYPMFTVSGLSAGTHTLRVVYDGSANVNEAVYEFQHTVLPAGAALPYLAATVEADRVRLDMLPAPNAANSLFRRTSGGAWTFVDSPSYPYVMDLNVVPGTAYQYRIHAVPAGGGVVYSNVVTVYFGPFTGPKLNGLVVKKVHFTELQTAINTFRTMAGLAPLQIDFTGRIRASHIAQMRTAINEARAALGMPAAAFGDAPVAGVTRIRAADLHQLRGALR